MVNALYASIWIFALWKWGDWKNWHRFYPTILFFILGDFIYLYLLSDYYPMWRYNPPLTDRQLGLTNVHISLSIMLVKYPATTIIYLSKFPEGNLFKKIVYILGWVLLYAINELIDIKTGLIKYYNGWNYGWSLVFNTTMFYVLWIHYRNPIVAWFISLCVIITLWQLFNVPTRVFR